MLTKEQRLMLTFWLYFVDNYYNIMATDICCQVAKLPIAKVAIC